MSKVCCVEDANVCPKSSSCSMVLRSACSHRHSRESSTVKEHLHYSSPSKSKHVSPIVKKESYKGNLSLESLESSLKQLVLKSAENSSSIVTGGLYNKFEFSESACQKVIETDSLNVSCAKELHFSQLSVSNNSSVYKNISHRECSSDYSSATDSDMNSSESLDSTSNMSRSRFTRSSVASARSLSCSEDEDDNTSIHRIVRPVRNNSDSNSNVSISRTERETSKSNFSISRAEREVTNPYLSMNNVFNHQIHHQDANNHFYSNRYSDSLWQKCRWTIWRYIYLKVIKVINFDVWLLYRTRNFGKYKAIFIVLLPLLFYLILALTQRYHYNEIISYENIAPLADYVSSKYSEIVCYFSRKEEVPVLDPSTYSSPLDKFFTYLYSLIGLFTTYSYSLIGLFTGWLGKTGKSASTIVDSSHHSNEFVYHLRKEELDLGLKSKEKELDLGLKSKEKELDLGLKSVQQKEKELDLGLKSVQQVWTELNSLRELMKSRLQSVETSILEKDNKVQHDVENLRLELKSLTETSKWFEKELINAKSEMKVNSVTVRSEYKDHIDKLSLKLKAIEAELGVLEHLKTCCDKQWSEADFLTLFEKHLILAFKNVMGADSDPNSKYHFYKEWLSSKFFNHEKLMHAINAALKEQSAHSKNKMNYDNVIQVVESTVLKHVESIKKNISESNLSGYSSFSADMFSEDKVKKIVKEAIMLYDADKIGQVDYALESGGGSVLGTRCSETYIEKYGKLSIFGFPLWTSSNSPRTAIQPEVQPGRCWAFKGSQGFLVIELSATIIPTGFTMEHIPVFLSPSGTIDSAPKKFSVWGLDSEKESKGKLLGEYIYDISGEPLQYFAIQEPSQKPYSYIELQIQSNHGNMEYTCLYRFRVHGKRVR